MTPIHRPLLRYVRLTLFALALVFAPLFGFAASPVHAATLSVTNTNDSGPGSLRQTIIDAASGDTITFSLPNPSTITLASELGINKNLTITGPGAAQLTISGNNVTRVFHVTGGTLTLEQVTVANGTTGDRDGGGGILVNFRQAATIRDAVFSGNRITENRSFGGGAISNIGGSLNVANSTFINNSSPIYGGAINSINNILNVTNSTFANNSAAYGASIITGSDTATVSNSTFSGDSISAGGSVDNFGSVLTITNSTFAGNTRGVSNQQGQMTIVNSTFFRNGTGIYSEVGGSDFTKARTTIVAESTSPNCVGAIIDEGYNFSDDASCPFTAPTSRNSVELVLDPAGLKNNGGPTQTVALLTGSPALNAIPVADCAVTTDQRGIARPQLARCDSGAYEYNGPAPSIRLNPASLPNGTVATNYSQQLGATGSNGSYSFAVTSGTLPPGISLSSTGLLSGTPTQTGASSFTVTASDGSGFSGSRAYTLTIGKGSTVTAITDDTPDPSNVGQAVSVKYTVTAGAGTPTGNVTVSDGTNSCTGTVAAGQCTITFTSPGSKTLTATYAGDANYNGSSSADEPHDVLVPNQPPTNISLSPASVAENQPAGTPVGTFSTSDPDAGDTFTYTLVDGAGDSDNASFSVLSDTLRSAASFDFEAKQNYTVRVRSTDQEGAFVEQRFTISVINVNEAPAASNDSYSTAEDSTLTIDKPGVLGNDSDPDADSTLSAQLVSGPSNGTLTLNPNGSFGYTPNANFNGSDNFSYRANDGTLGSNVATVSITVNAVNDAPLAQNDSYSTAEDSTLTIDTPGVLQNDTDVEDSTLSAQLVSGPSNGTLTLNPNGSFSYKPNTNYNGSDSFSYRASDGALTSNVATVNISITPINDAPTIAVAAGGACLADFRGQITLALGDLDSTAGSLTLSATSTNPALVPVSNVVFGGSGATRSATIASLAERSGTAVVTLTVSDGQASASTTVTVLVGTRSANTLAGTSGSEIIFGGEGVDTLTGNGGIDLLCGGLGDDRLNGGNDADTLDGGLNNDALTGGTGDDRLLGGEGVDTLDGSEGVDTLDGGAGGDILTGGTGDDRLSGGTGDDRLSGGSGADTLDGGEGTDRLDGENGNDVLNGGTNGDQLVGGDGDDQLLGGAGDDRLTGGTGADRFDGGPDIDTATDFNAAQGDTQVNIP